MASGRRHRHIETIRGFACLLLVAYHAIGNDTAHGMHVADTSSWRIFTELFVHIRMPLFSFISGLVFAPDPTSWPTFRSSLTAKLRRLGLPLLTVSSLFWLVSVLTGVDRTTPYTDVLWNNYQHFWFLQASLIITVVLLLAGLAFQGMRRAATILALPAVLLFLAAPEAELDVFSINQAVYLAPFFLAGLLVRTWKVETVAFQNPDRRPELVSGLGIVALGLFALNAADVFQIVDVPFERQSVLGLALGLATCLFLLSLRVESRWLSWIGGHSYAIYLFHVFFTSALRKGLLFLDASIPDGIVFAAGLAGGVLLPILVESVITRNRWASLLFLGQVPRHASSATASKGTATAQVLTRDPA